MEINFRFLGPPYKQNENLIYEVLGYQNMVKKVCGVCEGTFGKYSKIKILVYIQAG